MNSPQGNTKINNVKRVNNSKKNNNRTNTNKSINKDMNRSMNNTMSNINTNSNSSMNNMNTNNSMNNMNNNNSMNNMNNNSSRKLNDMANPFVKRMLESIHTIKLFHWKTKSYSTHKATDGLHGTLNELVDKFVEVLVGKYNLNLSMNDFKSLTINNLLDNAELEQFVKELCKYLSDMFFNTNETDLANIRDEILGELNQFLYLLRLN